MRDDVDIVPATAALAAAWFGGPPPFTMRGCVAVKGDRPVAIFGVYWIEGTAIAFSEWLPELGARAIARCFREGEKVLQSVPGTMYAVPQPDQAPTLLARLGFVPTGDEALGGPLLVRA
jgi:hypothetical protein